MIYRGVISSLEEAKQFDRLRVFKMAVSQEKLQVGVFAKKNSILLGLGLLSTGVAIIKGAKEALKTEDDATMHADVIISQ